VPTYSYRCQGCGVEFDVQQAFTDSSLTTCEGCGGALRKLFSAVGVTFNGSGFYRTDSRASAEAGKKAATAAQTKASTPEKATTAAPAAASSSGSSSSGSSSGSESSSSKSSPAKTSAS
jgi:putative FmdB family regulatory protein